MAPQAGSCGYLQSLAEDESLRAAVEKRLKQSQAFVETSVVCVLTVDFNQAGLVKSGPKEWIAKANRIAKARNGELLKVFGRKLLMTFRDTVSDARGLNTFTGIASSTEQDGVLIHAAMSTFVEMMEVLGECDRKLAVDDEVQNVRAAIVCGPVQNVVVGDLEHRLEYFIYCEGVQRAWDLIKKSKDGKDSLALDIDTWVTFQRNSSKAAIRPTHTKTEGGILFQLKDLKTSLSPVSSLEEMPIGARVPITKIGKEFLERFESTTAEMINEEVFTYIVHMKILETLSPATVQSAMLAFLAVSSRHNGIFGQLTVEESKCIMKASFTEQDSASEEERVAFFQQIISIVQETVHELKKFRLGFAITFGPASRIWQELDGLRRSFLLGEACERGFNLVTQTSTKQPAIVDESILRHAGEANCLAAIPLLSRIQSIPNAWSVPISTGVSEEEREKQMTQELVEKFSGGSGHGSRPMFGYKSEKTRILELLKAWIKDGKMSAVVVEGPSGIGKSTVMDFFTEGVRHFKNEAVITRIAKEDQLIPFSSIATVVQHMIKAFTFSIQQSAWASASGSNSQIYSSNNNNFDEKARLSRAQLPSLQFSQTNQTPVMSPESSRITLDGNANITSESIAIFLIRMNEDPSLAPLFAPFFSDVAGLEASDRTRDFSSDARKKIMVGMIVRLIGRWAKNHKAAFVFDDMQWIDSMSLEILAQVFRTKPEGLFLFICSRPIKDLDLTALKTIAASSNILHLPLTGLTSQDIGDYLVHAFSGITEIDPELIALFTERTASSPLALELAVRVLKRRNSFVEREGTLSFNSNSSAEVKKLLENNVNQTIMIQFGRLSEEFQGLVRAACILGQYFSLEDVLQMQIALNGSVKDQMTSKNAQPEPVAERKGSTRRSVATVDARQGQKKNTFTLAYLRDLIFTEDHFSFLTPQQSNAVRVRAAVDKPSPTTPPTSGAVPAKRAVATTNRFYFRHISIAVAVYESLDPEEKRRLHAIVGEILEKKIQDSNRDQILPLLYHHFTLSEIPEKCIVYGEALGLLFNEKGYKKESMKILQDLIQYVSKLPENDIPPEFRSKGRQASWHGTIATAAAAMYQSNLVISSAETVYKLVGVEFPPLIDLSDKRRVKNEIKKRLRRHIGLFITTSGGRKPYRGKQNPLARIPLEDLAVIDEALGAISWLAIATDKAENDFKALVLFELLNVDILLAEKKPYIWYNRAMTVAFFFLLKSRFLCKLYYNSALAAAARCKPEQRTAACFYEMSIRNAMYRDDSKGMEEFLKTFLEIFEKRGDVAGWQRLRNSLTLLHFPKSYEEAETIYVSKHDQTESDLLAAHISISFLFRCAIITKNMAGFEFCHNKLAAYKAIAISFFGRFPEYGTTPFHATGLWKAAITGNIEDAQVQVTTLTKTSKDLDLVSQHTIMAKFGYLAVWPLLSLLEKHAQDPKSDLSTPVGFNKARNTFVTAMMGSLKFVKTLAKVVAGDNFYFCLYQGAILTLQGKFDAAIRLLRKVVAPETVKKWKEGEPHWIGIAHIGLYMLTKSKESGSKVGPETNENLRQAKLIFEEIQGQTFLDWMAEAKPLSSPFWHNSSSV
ncbi:hypothetical protein HDU97_005334 [Phlyctochytrium planicorne]|nr:hypothetical protein HDU97_005334 [Phlyctochytrium planicorne]